MKIFRNLFFTLKKYKVATVANLLGLTLAFLLFMIICVHVKSEYGFDSNITGYGNIYQIENFRDDGIWDANWARPVLESVVNSSSQVENYGVTATVTYGIGIATSASDDDESYLETICRASRQYAEVFGFDILSGTVSSLDAPDCVLLSETIARKLFGDENPLGRPIYLTEFKGIQMEKNNEVGNPGVDFTTPFRVGGVYRDFPENTRLENAVYIPIMRDESMDDWNTGLYYGFLQLPSSKAGEHMLAQYKENNKELLNRLRIKDIRLRPLTELYFGTQARADSSPTGNKLRTDILFLIAILIIVIALVNYVNLSVALAPVRAKSITIRKVLGSTDSELHRNLVMESVGVSLISFLFAFGILLLARDASQLVSLLGHPVELDRYWSVPLWTLSVAIGGGFLAGMYPAWYITSFPAVMALNGTFSLSARAKSIRKGLVGFQFVISIALIIGSLFVLLQNRYISNVELGFDRENVLEVKMSMATGLLKSDAFCNMVKDHPQVREVALSQFQFVTDENRPHIGYNLDDNHSFMSWLGVSYNLPQMLDIKIVAGRTFRPSDQADDNPRAVCIINKVVAEEMLSWYYREEVPTIDDLIGKSIYDNSTPVEIVGITEDVHYESLYKDVRPLGLWTASKYFYRQMFPGNYAYVKIAQGDPTSVIKHIRAVADELNPGYPVDVRFFDESLGRLYSKSHNQGVLVALLCVLAVVLSLVGVFGLVIFETQGMVKEIAVRKVFGATIPQILRLFNMPFVRIILICAIISIPAAYYGVYVWLQGFAFRTQLYAWVAAVALAIILLLTLITVTLQSYRAATANPAQKC